jgi:superfamily II DNA or RNA helicase
MSYRSMSRRFTPRPYQETAVEQVLALHRRGTRSMLLHLPTGSGKTVIASLIIERLLPLLGHARVLFLAHRRELLDQTAATLGAHLPALRVGVEQGARASAGDAQVVIASIQSLVQRMELFRPQDFSLIICDECHRALAPGWRDVIRHFSEKRGDQALLLGMTATPRRTDGRSALEVFETVAYAISKAELQDLGYLVPIRYWTVRTDLHLDRVRRSGDDFQVASLSAVMNTAAVRALARTAWEQRARGRKSLVFCASVAHAHALSADFSAAGYRAAVVDGKTTDRAAIIDGFRRGDLDLLCNYGVLTEGFDEPTIECLLLARPTTSPLVYNQCLGRGLRPAPGKRDCVVIDIVDRSTSELQYGASSLAGLPRTWQGRGRDPAREWRSVRQVQVTDPAAFLAIQQASSLDEIQDLLMELPAEVVLAGLDGEPVPRYRPVPGPCKPAEAEAALRAVLEQAGARVRALHHQPGPISGAPGRDADGRPAVRIALARPELDNERFDFLLWHLERATGWSVSWQPARTQVRVRSPRALLSSMLPDGHRVLRFEHDRDGRGIVAEIAGVSAGGLLTLERKFEAESGLKLEIRGQLGFAF